MQPDRQGPSGSRQTALQSLFCWKVVCNRDRARRAGRLRDRSCSPCFAGRSYATMASNHHIRYPLHNVAVLVLLEGRMQLALVWRRAMSLTTLQSLFCWKVVCNSTASVSIQAISSRCSPCFAGRSYATSSLSTRSQTWSSCSPCFAGRSYATRIDAPKMSLDTRGCSPCFAGRSYATRARSADPVLAAPDVAVLVLLEGRMQLRTAKKRYDAAVEVAVLVLLEGRMQRDCLAAQQALKDLALQSLFCWKVVCNASSGTAISTGGQRRCSPCFAGRSYATYSITRYIQIANMLQSLFCWKVVCNVWVSTLIRSVFTPLQSLFCWKVVCNGRQAGQSCASIR